MKKKLKKGKKMAKNSFMKALLASLKLKHYDIKV
tara:strand:- start:1189 stop:1290 length:102 start_codon:yes stop_codon:yes gene_type:complete